MIRVSESDDPAPLEKYRRKRDPGRTNEPFSPEPATSGASVQRSAPRDQTGSFVVHEHHATRRHFDLRLEVSGVLKSFAVPRGPTLDPDERRLAVQTEDHPLAYLDYEGVIPEANYGAGPMIVWDTGLVRFLEQPPEQGLRRGKLDFELHGYKLRGRFALVLTRDKEAPRGAKPREQPHWILLKKRDAHAMAKREITEELPVSVLSGLRADELVAARERAQALADEARANGAEVRALNPRTLVPMACGTGQPKLESRAHVYELKLDGVRILAEKHGDEVRLFYRKGRTATAAYPEIVRALKALPPAHLVLDGELVAYDEQGRPDFQRLAQRFSISRSDEIRRAMQTTVVSYVAFDLLALEGLSLLALPLVTRKSLLSRLLPPRGPIRALDHIEGDGTALLAFCREQRLEGVIAKRADGPYRPGPHGGSDWLKLKCEREDDFVVVGYVRGQGGRLLGALDLASYEGARLVTRGKVGSGFDEATLALLLRQLDARRSEACAAEGQLVAAPRGRVFVRPELVVNVRHVGFTRDGQLRHPVFRGLRADVAPGECTARPPRERGEALVLPDELPSEPASCPLERGRARITNPQKIYWPDEGYTKGEMCTYYEAIAPVLLPFLRDRPVILVRYPDGIAGKSFYQWNAPKDTPSWVRTVRVQWDERDGKEVDLFLINDVDTLLYVANLGCIPLHILAARVGALAECDFLTIDFDLNGRTLPDAITLARELHTLLERLTLQGFPKTSGQTGLHVLVPLGAHVPFETARTLAELLGRLLVARHPVLATMERMKAKRGARVYVDTGQTGTIRAIVAPYSVRAYAGARVSTPLTWDEVGFALDPARYTMASVPARVVQFGCPMAGLLTAAPNLPRAIEALSKLLPQR